jgi:hypothetical protein
MSNLKANVKKTRDMFNASFPSQSMQGQLPINHFASFNALSLVEEVRSHAARKLAELLKEQNVSIESKSMVHSLSPARRPPE